MSTRKESIIEKIQALMARANHPTANEHEAVACAAKAVELMQKYGVESSDLQERPCINHESREKVDTWKERLVIVIQMAFGLRAVSNGNGSVTFIGETMSLEIALYVFDQLKNKIEALAKAYVKQWFIDFENEHGVDYKTYVQHHRYIETTQGWMRSKSHAAQRQHLIKSFAYGVTQTLYDTMVKPKQTQPQTEGLVLVKYEIESYMRNVLYIHNLRTKQQRRVTVAGDAINDGRVAGKNINVQSGLGSKTGQKLLG